MHTVLCDICPRRCGTARDLSRGEGICGMGTLPVVARAALHFWEEPCISGSRGSGAIFFCGCPLRCVFCQNKSISRGGGGKTISVERLRGIFLELVRQGAHNINLVTPTHFSESILSAIGEGLEVPVVYNCGGYENIKTLQQFEGKVQIYLPDMKYSLPEPATRYSSASDYPDTAKKAILEMYRQTGPYVLDSEGVMQKGVLIRHLVLPGNLENTFGVIDWVAETFPKNSVLFSLMGQYTPSGEEPFPALRRRLTKKEYAAAEEYLLNAGIEDGFVQTLDAADGRFLPSFDLTGV